MIHHLPFSEQHIPTGGYLPPGLQAQQKQSEKCYTNGEPFLCILRNIKSSFRSRTAQLNAFYIQPAGGKRKKNLKEKCSSAFHIESSHITLTVKAPCKPMSWQALMVVPAPSIQTLAAATALLLGPRKAACSSLTSYKLVLTVGPHGSVTARALPIKLKMPRCYITSPNGGGWTFLDGRSMYCIFKVWHTVW